MPRISVDGTEYEVAEGRTLLQALDDLGVLMNGVDIPHYCWHPKLTIDGSCRLCQVEIEGIPKLQIACSMPIQEGMKVHTKSQRVQDARAALSLKPPLLVKLAPDIAEEDLPEVVRVILAHGADGIVVSNTTLSRGGLRDPGFAKEAGGLSGRPLFARSTRMLARVHMLSEGKLALIGVGGIDSPETVLAKIEAGASLLQLYTGLVFEGPGLIGRIKQTLIQAMEREGHDTLAPMVGKRAAEWSERVLPS
jgi:dihydroorotate dehydrogenase